MRVVLHPTTLGAAGNPYVDHVDAGLRAAGVDVLDFTRRGMVSGVDVVHVNWPAYLVDWSSRRRAVFEAGRILAYLAIARARGTRVVWTAHDLGSHDRQLPRLRRLYERAFAACVSDVVSLSAAGIPLLRKRFPELRRARFHVVPHGHYRDDYDVTTDRDRARRRLGLPVDGQVVLQFGQLRRYKGIDGMIRAFGELGRDDVTLVVAGGSKDEAYTRELTALAADTPGVVLHPRRVPDDEVGLYLAACDVLYAAYPPGTSLNSGVAVLGVSFARPVVTRDTPVLRELGETVGTDWVVPAAPGPDQETAALARALDLATGRDERPGPDLSALDWDRLVGQLVDVYSGRDAPKV